MSSPLALILGIVVGLTVENPRPQWTRALARQLLAWSIVALGAGMNLRVVVEIGVRGIGYTAATVAGTLAAGIALGRILRIDRDAAVLISVGTAICGGSAIAAVAPAIRARHAHTSIALATIYVLNAVALLAFPILGGALHLGHVEFGLWSALAIHDTSSVVAATLAYGGAAPVTGTTVKLARALWIVPVTIGVAHVYRTRGRDADAALPWPPWFIPGFVTAAALVTWFPGLRPTGDVVSRLARELLTMAMFLIGTDLTRDAIREIGFRPLFHGVVLWLLVAGGTLAAVLGRWIEHR